MGDFKGGRGGSRSGGRGGFGGGRGGAPRGEGGRGAGGFSRGPRREGGTGFKPRGEGGYSRGPRPEGAEGGYRPREGGFKPRGEGGYSRGPRRDGEGFKPRGESGFSRSPRPEGAEGGYRPREGGFKPRGEGGYSRGPRREGEGFKPRGEGGYSRGEGGYSRGPRRDGEGFKPRGEGGYSRGPRREGGFKPRGEGGYSRGPRRDDRFAPRDEAMQDDGATGERTVHGKQTHWVEKDPYANAPGSDGWLVGKHAVQGAIVAGRRVVKQVLLAGDESEVAAFAARFPEVRVTTVSRADLDSRFTGQVHQGIAAEVGNLPQPDLADLLATAPRLLVGLDQVTDPHNFGAILRSCAAFGVGGIIATERRSAGVTSVVAKAAAGALEIVPVAEVTNLANALQQVKAAGYRVVGMAGEAEQAWDSVTIAADEKICVVLGSEGEGLRRLTREICDLLVALPMSDKVESLNVSVAAGVMLSKLFHRG